MYQRRVWADRCPEQLRFKHIYCPHELWWRKSLFNSDELKKLIHSGIAEIQITHELHQSHAVIFCSSIIHICYLWERNVVFVRTHTTHSRNNLPKRNLNVFYYIATTRTDSFHRIVEKNFIVSFVSKELCNVVKNGFFIQQKKRRISAICSFNRKLAYYRISDWKIILRFCRSLTSFVGAINSYETSKNLFRSQTR